MARIRTIKPQHVNDKELSKISIHAHLFWILSWCFSDDEGVLENDPLLLKSQLFPRRTDIRIEQVQQWIDQLIEARFMIPFTHNGDSYLLQRTFKVHQKIDRPQESKIPKDVIRRILDECSTNVRPCIVEESIVKESKGGGVADAPAPRFVKPDKYQLEEFFKEIGLDDFSAQAQATIFINHFDSNGWKIGGKAPMKDWKAAARNWKTRMNENKNNGNNRNNTQKPIPAPVGAGGFGKL